jgi:hypothetical protein
MIGAAILAVTGIVAFVVVFIREFNAPGMTRDDGRTCPRPPVNARGDDWFFDEFAAIVRRHESERRQPSQQDDAPPHGIERP